MSLRYSVPLLYCGKRDVVVSTLLIFSWFQIVCSVLFLYFPEYIFSNGISSFESEGTTPSLGFISTALQCLIEKVHKIVAHIALTRNLKRKTSSCIENVELRNVGKPGLIDDRRPL